MDGSDDLAARCAALAEEVAHLRGLLGEREDSERYVRLRQNIAVAPQPARLILSLYGAGGRTVPGETLIDAIRARECCSDRLLSVVVHHARNALGRGIDTIRVERDAGYVRVGYRMTPAGLERVADILATDGPPVRRYARSGRLDEATVRAVRSDRRPGRGVAAQHGVSAVMIHKIRTRKSYAWVSPTPIKLGVPADE